MNRNAYDTSLTRYDLFDEEYVSWGRLMAGFKQNLVYLNFLMPILMAF